MKTIKKSSLVWLSLLIVAVVLVVVYFGAGSMPLVPDDLLADVKPGMTINEVNAMLGKSNGGVCTIDSATVNSPRNQVWTSPSQRLKALVPNEADPFSHQKRTCFWISDKQRLLWVESQQGMITRFWILPLVRIDDDSF